MVINDVYDVETDKINNPLRPIPSGQIKIYEAIILNLLLLGTAEYLSIRFLSTNPQLLVDFVIVVVGIYTSILKRIPLIKNVSCAGIVALSIFFAGLASNTETALITENKNFGLLAIAVDLIFYGSLSNEILLDIRDYDGDKANKIYTLPVIFGKDIALISANIITNLNIMSNGLALMYLTNFYYGGLLILLCFPLSFNLFQLRNKNNNNNSNEQIIKVVNDTTIPLFFILLYMCVLASINHF
jgi:4-hydroxybenzoate polyprenyltransferase